MKKALVIAALALAVMTLSTLAQNAGVPPSGGGRGHGWHGFHVLPPGAREQLHLTAAQQKQVADLEAEVTTRMEKILTPEQLQQLQQLQQARPPHQQGGTEGGGPGAGGPPGEGGGAENQPNSQRGPNE
jgi:Spy/CpxP family protein refolding chaperone